KVVLYQLSYFRIFYSFLSERYAVFSCSTPEASGSYFRIFEEKLLFRYTANCFCALLPTFREAFSVLPFCKGAAKIYFFYLLQKILEKNMK
ncbi:MAG: hypothetical protein MI922_10140, partial [Bacteroidales bacterium]|nr:hypothetical protein [Bacteroidales bacterium]